MTTVDKEYRDWYSKGWRYSGSPTASLEHGDRMNAPPAWYDGYHDRAAGRPKWDATVPMKVINKPHCQQCGSTDYEDTQLGDQGYSACCNEIVVWGGDCNDGHCYHK